MAEPKLDNNWQNDRQFRIRPFLVAGTALLLLFVALVLSTVKGCTSLGSEGRKSFFSPTDTEGEGFVGKTNELLATLLSDCDETIPVVDLMSLNQRYPALEFALPYGEDQKTVIEASDLRLVGIHPERIKSEKWRNFYFNSRLPQLLRQQREETSETFFEIKAQSWRQPRDKAITVPAGVRPIEITSIRLYASMFKVALVKNPWKGEIRGRQNCLFDAHNAIFLTYGSSMVPVPKQSDFASTGAGKEAIRAVMDTCMLLDGRGHPIDYYDIYRRAFDTTNAERERSVSIWMCETRGAMPKGDLQIYCTKANKPEAKDSIKIISGNKIIVYRGKKAPETIKAHTHGGQKFYAPIAVDDGMKLAVYDQGGGRKLGEFVVNTTDPTRRLSSIIQSSTGQTRHNIPASQTDLFTQQVIRGVTRHLSAEDNATDVVDLSIDPMLSLELEKHIRSFVATLPEELPAGKPASQRNEQYDMSVTVMDIATGEVIATPFYTTKFDPADYPQQLKMTTRNVALSRRYVGSTFKPFVAIAALQANPNLIDLNTAGHCSLGPKNNTNAKVDRTRKADFFGYTILNPWAQTAPSHWNGCGFTEFLAHSDDVYPVALAAIAMTGEATTAAIPLGGSNCIFEKHSDNNLYLKKSKGDDSSASTVYRSHPFFHWLTYITDANPDCDTDNAERNPLRGIIHRHPDDTDDAESDYGLREITPDITNLHLDRFCNGEGGTMRSEIVPWVLGQGSNEWSAVTMAQAWARMIGRQSVVATYLDTRSANGKAGADAIEPLVGRADNPGCNTTGGRDRSPEAINRTWNEFLDRLGAAASGGTLAPMNTAVNSLNSSLGETATTGPLVLFCKTGTPDAYSRYEAPLMGAGNRFFDIGMFSFALMPQSAVRNVREGKAPQGIVCVVRVTRTYQCNKCRQETQCKACSDYNGLQSSTARDFFAANPRRLRMLYDMTRRYYAPH